MKLYSDVVLFVAINFIVSFLSDIGLNILSTQYNIVPSLRPYFYKQNMFVTGAAAGLTIVIALVINMLISYLLYGFIIPTNMNELIKFCLLGFLLGYVIDILIYKMKIFGNRLNMYYKELGAGFWGAAAFVFSILISYIIQKYILVKI
jgi:hypothetical protein